MSEPRFQVLIVSASKGPRGKAKGGERLGVRQHKRRASKVIERIDDLEGIWDKVIEKLTGLAEKTDIGAAVSKYELSSIEFNVGIEAGLDVGLVTKGEASVSVTFTRKSASE